MDAKTLIDAAAKNLGGKAALAREIGVSPQKVSAWYAGRDPLPIDTRAFLAELAGRSAVSELATAAIERAKGKPFAERLATALKKSVAGAVAMWLGFAASGNEAFAGTLALTPTTDNV
jgi:YdaS antitoxin of YdaST toxin-antitoxin system